MELKSFAKHAKNQERARDLRKYALSKGAIGSGLNSATSENYKQHHSLYKTKNTIAVHQTE